MAATGTTESKDQKVNAEARRGPLSSISPRIERTQILKSLIRNHLERGRSLERILHRSIERNLMSSEIMCLSLNLSLSCYISLSLGGMMRQDKLTNQ